jgi:hypothetical protein
MAEAAQVLAPGTWQLREEWAAKSLLLLGNIHTYDVLSLLAAWSTFLLARSVLDRAIDWKRFLRAGVAFALR